MASRNYICMNAGSCDAADSGTISFVEDGIRQPACTCCGVQLQFAPAASSVNRPSPTVSVQPGTVSIAADGAHADDVLPASPALGTPRRAMSLFNRLMIAVAIIAVASYLFTLTLPARPSSSPVFTSRLNAAASVGTRFVYDISVVPGDATVQATNLPMGFALQGNQIIASPPQEAGTYRIDLTASKDERQATAELTVVVSPAAGGGQSPPAPSVKIVQAAAGPATVGVPFAYEVATLPTTATVQFSNIPPWLSASGNVLRGTPSAAGTFLVKVEARHGVAQDKAALEIIVSNAPAGTPWLPTAPQPVPQEVQSALVAIERELANVIAQHNQWHRFNEVVKVLAAPKAQNTIPLQLADTRRRALEAETARDAAADRVIDQLTLLSNVQRAVLEQATQDWLGTPANPARQRLSEFIRKSYAAVPSRSEVITAATTLENAPGVIK